VKPLAKAGGFCFYAGSGIGNVLVGTGALARPGEPCSPNRAMLRIAGRVRAPAPTWAVARSTLPFRRDSIIGRHRSQNTRVPPTLLALLARGWGIWLPCPSRERRHKDRAPTT